MNMDLSRWAVIAPNNDTGLGRMAQDMKSLLPLGRHFVTDSDWVEPRALSEPREVLFDAGCSTQDLEGLLEGLHGVIFFERHGWHPALLVTARRMGIRTVCVPMWEWFRGRSPQWANCDFFACPNAMCLRIVRGYGFENAALIPWMLDLSRLPERVVKGAARHFVHNAGLVDADDRKGTRDAVAAFARVQDPGLRLTVRMQKEVALPQTDRRVQIRTGNLPDPAALYSEGEAFIQPSKLEGMGFMVLEAVACGLPVITLDIPPVNEWGDQCEMHARVGRFRWPAHSSAWVEHSHLRQPDMRDLAAKITWAATHDLGEISERNRAWALDVFDPERLRSQWCGMLAKVLSAPARELVIPGGEPLMPGQKLSHRARQMLLSATGLRLPLFNSQP